MNTITLLDGTVAGVNEITFNTQTYHFYWDSGAAGMLDITNLITRADKQNNWSNFDPSTENRRIYNEGLGTPTSRLTGRIGPIAPLDDSIASNFVHNIEASVPKVATGIGIGVLAIGGLLLVLALKK